MRYPSQAQPISKLEDDTAESLIRHAERNEPMVIARNSKAGLHDVASFEDTQETLALLILS